MNTHPKPITIITGFLGAGKTTLLNAFLNHKKETRFAIIENEVGEIGIDGSLIIKNTDSFTEMNNGCICCSLNTNFIDTLRNLTQRSDWDEVIIEATGVADPGGIIMPFKQYPWLQKYFETPQVVCVADAQNANDQLALSETTTAQLAYADKIYIGKTDLVDAGQTESLRNTLSGFNPFASFYFGNKTQIPVADLLERNKAHHVPHTNTIEHPQDHHHDHEQKDHDHHHEHFEAISLEYDQAFDENKLYARLYIFLMLQSVNVYRFKGIFYDPAQTNKKVIQSVMKTVVVDEGESWMADEPRISRFVFIGKNLKKPGFDKMLRQCLKKDDE